MRLIALVALAACQASPPLPEGGARVDALAGHGTRAAACYEGSAPAELARALAAKLRAHGWEGVRVLTGGDRMNVVARRGAESYSALLAPDACGTRVTAGVVAGDGVRATEIGPGGPGPTRL